MEKQFVSKLNIYQALLPILKTNNGLVISFDKFKTEVLNFDQMTVKINELKTTLSIGSAFINIRNAQI